MVVAQGDVFWLDLEEPKGPEPGYARPVVVVQGNSFNRSKIATAVCVVITSSRKSAGMPGNVLLPAKVTGLPDDSVANVSQIVTVDRDHLSDRVGHLPASKLQAILRGIDVVLGR